MENKQGERIQDQVVNAVEQVGAKITEFFSGNPLETEVGRMIVSATNADVVKGENWSLIMAICDYIIEASNGARDALKAIRKQLADNINKSPQTIIYTLVVLEAAVKNCGVGFASLVCKNEFLDELIKIVKKDTPPQLQEKVLYLIQTWADAFRGVPECSEVAQYYDDLKKRGIEFPATDLDSLAPIITPKRTVFNDSVKSGGGASSRSSQPGIYVAAGQPQLVTDDAAIAKIQVELSQAKKHAQSFLDLLSKLPPIQTITEQDLREKLQKIYETTKKIRDRTAILVQHIYENQALVTEILDCNDLLTNGINIYENALNPKEPEPTDPSLPGPSTAKPQPQSSGLVFDQTDAPLNVAAFNKTEPITDRVTEQLENWLLTDKKEPEEKTEKKDDGL